MNRDSKIKATLALTDIMLIKKYVTLILLNEVIKSFNNI